MESKDNQVKDVVIGLALGVLAQGVTAVTSNKMAFEFAFEGAWRDWPNATNFPSLRGHNVGNLFWIGAGRSGGRRGACAAWREGKWNEPYIAYSGWTVNECLDHIADGRARSSDWEELGRLFVAEFKDDQLVLLPTDRADDAMEA